MSGNTSVKAVYGEKVSSVPPVPGYSSASVPLSGSISAMGSGKGLGKSSGGPIQKRDRSNSHVYFSTGQSPDRKKTHTEFPEGALMPPCTPVLPCSTDDSHKILVDLHGMVSNIQSSLDSMRQRMDHLDSSVTNIQQDFSSVRSEIGDVKRDMGFYDTVLERLLDSAHMSEVSSVKNDAVVSGYPKGMSPEERVAHFSSTHKIPKDSLRPRGALVFVRFTTVQKKKDFIKKFKASRPSVTHAGKQHSIYISPSRTSVQRLKDDQLRQARDHVRSQREGSVVTINYGERKIVCDGRPVMEQDRVGRIVWTTNSTSSTQ